MFPKKRISFFEANAKHDKKKAGLTLSHALAAILAGVLNGLLGTGGGIPLYFVLSRERAGKAAYATASIGVLLLSFTTLFLYRGSAVSPDTVSPFLPFLATLGGVTGALLLGRINPKLLRICFSLLLILSGVYVIGKELYHALFV